MLMETIGTRIKQARTARNMTQREVAEHFGIQRVSVTQWENDTTTPDIERIPVLAALLGVSADWLLEAKGAAPSPTESQRSKGFKPRVVEGGQLVRQERTLPLYAAARGGDGHVIVTFEAIEYLKMPTILEGVRGGYGLLITGESMDPAYRTGDMALVNPNLPPQRDTDVILYHTPPGDGGETEAIIKRLDGLNDREWTLEQYNPRRTFKEYRADWPICHRVVGKYNSR